MQIRIARISPLFLLTTYAVLLVGLAPAARAADDMLVVTQDESSMERVIESNLKTVHNLTINEKFATADDLYLDVPMKGDPSPAYRFMIDTQPANRDDKTHQVIERTILVNLNSNVKVPAGNRAAVLDILNDYNRKKIFACAYIDTDGEIILGWDLNVLSQGLPVENVYDIIAREDKIWRGMYPEVAKAIQ